MLPDFGDDEKNWAILFVVFEVDGARLRVEEAMIGIAGAGVAAGEEDENRLGFRGMLEYVGWVWRWVYMLCSLVGGRAALGIP